MFKSPLVVGYKGEIGSFILAGLLKVMPKALNIWCFDINETEQEKIERIKKSDYIFLCVPLNKTKNWLLSYLPYLENKTIVEQCSLKSFLYNDPRFDKLNFIGMHLLFRPSATPNHKDRRCILFRLEEKWFADVVEKMTNSDVHVMTHYAGAEEHDKAMAHTQGLVHRVILALDEAMKYDKAMTYVSGRIRALADRIKQGDPELYKAIQDNENNPIAFELFEKLFKDFDIEKYMK